jgi:hypothetical protein
MKNWLRRKLHSFLWPEDQPEAYQDDRKMATLSSTRSGRHHNSLGSENEPLRFTVYNASGGKIVEISHYDQKRDRHETSLHIITSDEDFGESLGKIAFLEVLKKG